MYLSWKILVSFSNHSPHSNQRESSVPLSTYLQCKIPIWSINDHTWICCSPFLCSFRRTWHYAGGFQVPWTFNNWLFIFLPNKISWWGHFRSSEMRMISRMILVGKFLLSCYSERGEANLTVLPSRLGYVHKSGILGHCFFAVTVRAVVSVLSVDKCTFLSFVHLLCRKKRWSESSKGFGYFQDKVCWTTVQWVTSLLWLVPSAEAKRAGWIQIVSFRWLIPLSTFTKSREDNENVKCHIHRGVHAMRY